MKRVFSRNGIILILLLLVISLASFLRFYNLEKKGLVMFDEAYFLMETRFVLNLFSQGSYLKALSLHPDPIAAGSLLVDFGFPLMNYKPGHILLTALLSLVIGLKDYTGLFLSAITGVITIYLTYLLGKTLYNKGTGLLASLFLALMPYHIFYSRTGFPEMDSSLFFLIGILLYYLSSRPEPKQNLLLILSGFAVGFSITCNFRLSIYSLVFFLAEIYLYLTISKRPILLIERLLTFGLSLLFPIFIFEIYSLILALNYPILKGYPTYIQRLVELFCQDSPKEINIYPFLLFLWRLVGPLGCLLFFSGVVFLLKRRSFEDLFIIAVFLIPFVLYSFITSFTTGPRSLSNTLPAIALIMAGGVFELTEYFKSLKRKTLLYGLTVTLISLSILLNGIEISKILRLKSNYREAVQYIIDHGNKRYLTTSRVSSIFYQKSYYSNWSPYTLEDARLAYNTGYRYLVFDQRKYTERDRIPFVKIVQGMNTPCYEIPNNVGRYWVHFYDDGLGDLAEEIVNDESFGKILIYDLDEVFKKKG